MSGQDTRPTPVSGMPAAVAATSAAKPTLNENSATSPQSSPTEGAAEKLLSAFDAFQEEARAREAERDRKLEERDRKLDERFAQVHRRIDEVVGETKQNTRLWSEQAELLTRVAGAAAKAADLALEAKQATTRAPDEMKQLVESALRIHVGAEAAAIAATVDEAVKRAVKPLADNVEAIEKREEDRDRMLERSNQALGAVVNELGIEDQVELGREVKAGEKRPERALKKLETRARESRIVQFVIALSILAKLIADAFHIQL